MSEVKNNKPFSAIATLLSEKTLGSFDLDIDKLCEQTSTSKNRKKTEIQESISDSSENVIQNTKFTKNENKAFLIELPCSELSPWRYSDRPENEMGDLNDLADSIKQHGQQSAALVRKKEGQYELIFGHRRWRACKQLGINLLCRVVADLSDETAAALQTSENFDRQDISDYARALSFKRLLDNNVFESEAKLCVKLRISKTTINDILSYTRLPKDVLDNLTNIHKISRRTIVKLSVLLKDINNKKYLDSLLEKINEGEITSTNIESFLTKMKLKLHTNLPSITRNDDLGIKIKKNKDGSVKFTIDVPRKLVPSSVDKAREDIKKMFS